MMKRMGISDEDLDNLNNEMLQAMGGMENVEDLPGGRGRRGGRGKTATFPFLNRLFTTRQSLPPRRTPLPVRVNAGKRKSASPTGSGSFWRVTASL